MKKYYFALVFTAVVLGIVPGTLAAVIEFAPAMQTVTVGDTVLVDLNISDLNDASAPSLGVFDLDVSFDPTLLSFSNVVYGDADLGDQLDFSGLGAYYETSADAGAVNLYGLSFDAPDSLDTQQATEFTLARLTFESLQIGTSVLGVSIVDLGDADGNPLDATTVNGAVSVVPEPASLLLLASGLISLVGMRRRKYIGR